jgi:cytochrome oxidase Cu insertion factor (SCO1/SenC/PrrC family)
VAEAQRQCWAIRVAHFWATNGFVRQLSKAASAATGDKKESDALTRAFSVYRQTEGGTISHGLATALINRDGKIDKIWRGNGWTPAEVTEAIEAQHK